MRRSADTSLAPILFKSRYSAGTFLTGTSFEARRSAGILLAEMPLAVGFLDAVSAGSDLVGAFIGSGFAATTFEDSCLTRSVSVFGFEAADCTLRCSDAARARSFPLLAVGTVRCSACCGLPSSAEVRCAALGCSVRGYRTASDLSVRPEATSSSKPDASKSSASASSFRSSASKRSPSRFSNSLTERDLFSSLIFRPVSPFFSYLSHLACSLRLCRTNAPPQHSRRAAYVSMHRCLRLNSCGRGLR